MKTMGLRLERSIRRVACDGPCATTRQSASQGEGTDDGRDGPAASTARDGCCSVDSFISPGNLRGQGIERMLGDLMWLRIVVMLALTAACTPTQTPPSTMYTKEHVGFDDTMIRTSEGNILPRDRISTARA